MQSLHFHPPATIISESVNKWCGPVSALDKEAAFTSTNPAIWMNEWTMHGSEQQSLTRMTSDQHKWTMCIKCRVTAWVTAGTEARGSVGRSKPMEKTEAPLMKNRVKTGSRGGGGGILHDTHTRLKGYEELSFTVYWHLGHASKMGLPFCIQHIRSTRQYGGSAPLGLSRLTGPTLMTSHPVTLCLCWEKEKRSWTGGDVQIHQVWIQKNRLSHRSGTDVYKLLSLFPGSILAANKIWWIEI